MALAQYGTLITTIGLAQIANAQITQTKVGLEYIALGDGNGAHYVPTQNQTALVHEVWRGPIAELSIDPTNNNRIIIDAVIPVTAGGFTIREIGIFDDKNQLIAIGQYPEKYKPQLSEGVSEETLIHFVIETNNADVVKLNIDPTVIIATRKYVDAKVADAVGNIGTDLTELKTEVTTHKDDDERHKTDDDRNRLTLAHLPNALASVDGRNYVLKGVIVNLGLYNPSEWRTFISSLSGNSPLGKFVCFVNGGDVNVASFMPHGTLSVLNPWNDISGGGIIQNIENDGITLKRYATSETSWSPWVRILDSKDLMLPAPTTAVLAAGWSATDVDTHTPLSYYKDIFGVVHLYGIPSRQLGAPTLVTTLPVGYRPKKIIAGIVSSGLGVNFKIGNMTVDTNGNLNIYVDDTQGSTYVNLSFRTDV